jgi:hypothetical protein
MGAKSELSLRNAAYLIFLTSGCNILSLWTVFLELIEIEQEKDLLKYLTKFNEHECTQFKIFFALRILSSLGSNKQAFASFEKRWRLCLVTWLEYSTS